MTLAGYVVAENYVPKLSLIFFTYMKEFGLLKKEYILK